MHGRCLDCDRRIGMGDTCPACLDKLRTPAQVAEDRESLRRWQEESAAEVDATRARQRARTIADAARGYVDEASALDTANHVMVWLPEDVERGEHSPPPARVDRAASRTR